MKKHIFLEIAALITGFILWNSLQNATVSSGFSTRMLAYIHGFLGAWSKDVLTEYMIRKCAHMTEFALQSFCMGMGLSMDKNGNINWKKVLLFSLCTACIDESIQYFVPGRDGKVSDVLVDMLGSGVGVAAGKRIR